ncbi:MAG: thioredoxin domain-containing protein [Bacteroidetes bacterium]|nr:MAG: thioredoxin domain-containing protein [Bacteroidota bacterium]
MTLPKYLLSISLLITLNSCGQKKETTVMHQHTNELIKETSPYLLQHAHNPVDWHAWNSKSLATAKELGKPILISIGYSSCHWCHVMEHESFENEVIAEYMNEHFFCIKVDREERPDVDQIYMTAANIITGSGGWPLNCFALPDGRPFHAGTYYPASGWIKLLQSVDLQYTNNREKLEDYATKLTKGIEMQETAISDNQSQKLDVKKLVAAVEGWKANWDMTEGGMNRSPKFPMPSNFNYLLDYTHHFDDSYSDSFINVTLTKMAYGGIFDQIGGGFSRYSVDELWKAPHFEKMLYDNAQLLTIYSKAYKRFKDPLYKEIVEKTIVWLEREMFDESNMFYAALDADSEGEEGKFYVWKSKEVKDILDEDFNLAQIYYEIGKKGLWEHGNNILLRNRSDIEIASKFNITPNELKQRISSINTKLLKSRSSRIRPGLDDKCLTAWNALLITGLCEAYKATGNDHYKTLATNCLDAIIKLQIEKENNVWHTYKQGKSTINGMLEDYSFVAEACISAYEITSNEEYIIKSKLLVDKAIEKFYDADKELFYFNEANELIVRTSEVYDNVIPSTNSSMANVLLHLGLIYGNPSLLSMSENLIGKVQDNISNYPGGHSNWARAHLKHTMPFYEIAIVGKNAKQITKSLQSNDLNNTLIIGSDRKSNIPLFKDRFINGTTKIYVCQKGVCQLPVETIEEALKLMNP